MCRHSITYNRFSLHEMLANIRSDVDDSISRPIATVNKPGKLLGYCLLSVAFTFKHRDSLKQKPADKKTDLCIAMKNELSLYRSPLDEIYNIVRQLTQFRL